MVGLPAELVSWNSYVRKLILKVSKHMLTEEKISFHSSYMGRGCKEFLGLNSNLNVVE